MRLLARVPWSAIVGSSALVAQVVLVVACGNTDGRRARDRARSDTSAARSASSVANTSTGRDKANEVALEYTAPADSLIPRDAMGASIRRGLALITHTTDSLPRYAPGNIQCVSCHVETGRRRNGAPLIGVFARYPKYLNRSGAVVPIEDRVNYCITRSLAGTKLPSDSREMQDIVAYLAYVSTGVPHGAHVAGEGMPTMPKMVGDTAHGARLFATTCAACHGPSGQGNPPTIPALWGPKSYSIGASMSREERAASFIRHLMPQNNPGSLTDQQAYDLAAYINAQPRPDTPGKEKDWPFGDAPIDVPYATARHAAYRPPARLLPRSNPSGALVPPPASVLRSRR